MSLLGYIIMFLESLCTIRKKIFITFLETKNENHLRSSFVMNYSFLLCYQI